MRAWTVWVPEGDRDAAALLEAAGHRLDAAPTAMVRDLASLDETNADGLDWDADAAVDDVTRINDLAYGFEVGTFGGAMTRVPPGLAMRLYQARVDGEPACVMATVDDGADCGIYLVATLRRAPGPRPRRRPPPRRPRRGPRAGARDLEPPVHQVRLPGVRAARVRADLRAGDVGAPRVNGSRVNIVPPDAH